MFACTSVSRVSACVSVFSVLFGVCVVLRVGVLLVCKSADGRIVCETGGQFRKVMVYLEK